MAKNIHMVGIGGIGTSSLAQILHEQGNRITGSDSVPSQITKNLNLKGIKVHYDHDEKHVDKKIDLVICSPAIPKNNPELVKARELGIECLNYPQALGELSKEYFTIAITGTHGKSTTTAMLANILIQADFDPTIVIGTKMPELKNRNYRAGKSKYLIIEACEYKESFLNFNPKILVLTNIEAEHLDHYKTYENYKKAFEKFVKKVPKDGKIIINSKDKKIKSITKNAKAEIIHAEEKIKTGIPGDFNIENASLAAETAKVLGINPQDIKRALKNYKGSWRRMEYKKKLGKTIFIDDYAHHPTEIKMTLKAIKEKYPKKKLLCIFQPHQYSRTKTLLKEFAKSFAQADKVIVPNIYKVRDNEEDMKNISAEILVNEINKAQVGDRKRRQKTNKTKAITSTKTAEEQKAMDGKGLKETANYIKKNFSKYDLIVTMGAGDINNIYRYLQTVP